MTGPSHAGGRALPTSGRILIIGGTSESRAIAEAMAAAGYPVLLSVVTGYGADLARRETREAVLRGADLDIRQGELDEDTLRQVVARSAAVVDASHPFAGRITAAAQAACRRTGVPYVRLERRPAELGDVHRAPDAEAAARLAVTLGGDGTILLTVGTRTLRTYAQAAMRAGRRIVARVLPTEESLRLCREAGLATSDVIAMQGPTSGGLDEALLRHLSATVLVTKESGEAGGVPAKLAAARAAGAAVVVVSRPPTPTPGETGDASAGAGDTPAGAGDAPTSAEDLPSCVGDVHAVLEWVARTVGPAARDDAYEAGDGDRPHEGGPPRPRLTRGLLQVYTGDGKGKSTAAAGLALRARGRGLSVALVQFLKGGPESGELAPLRAAGVTVVRPAVERSGTLRGTVTEEDRRSAGEAWQTARGLIADGRTDLVVLDELHNALRRHLVDLDEVTAVLAARPAHVEVVTTGRGAPAELCAAADLVTEMVARRHPYPGVKARKGVEL